MSSFREYFAEDRRLVILRCLLQAPGYTANEYMVQSTIAGFGHSVSRDVVRTDLAWLEEQGLLQVKKATGMSIATMTERGADVAAGRAEVPGVKRPAPGAG